MYKSLLAAAIVVLSYGSAAASNPTIEKYVPQAKLVGEGRMTYLLWDVYDAALFAPEGKLEPAKPFALQLSYLRALKGKAIADRSVEEIRKQGFTDEVKLATWHGQMRAIFPDVQSQTQIIGIYSENGETVFYRDGDRIGQIRDPEFGKRFFDIWLSPKTSAPDLRANLLSQR